MSSTQYGTAAAKPVRLVAGRWRTWLRRLRIARALLPALAPVWAALILVVRLDEPASYGWAILYATITAPWWLRWVRAAYWRSRWVWDARAAGLSRFAEAGVNLSYDHLGEDTLEVAPALIRLSIDEHRNRRYTLRPLPGSTAGEYQIAAELLRTRWRAAAVQIVADESGSRFARGRVVIVVILGRVIEDPLALPVELIR